MKFCRECNNILYPKEDKERKVLLYACRNCEHQEVADNYCVFRHEVDHPVTELTQELQDVLSDPTLPRTKSVKCALCGHPEAVFFQLVRDSNKPTRNEFKVNPSRCHPCFEAFRNRATTRGEEAMTLFFVCCNPCGHRWRD